MADRNFHQLKGSLDRGLVFVVGTISLAADASVSSESIVGASVSKTGAGEYTLLLEDKYPYLKCVQLTAESATGVNVKPQVKSSDVSVAKTVVINTLVAGAVNDVVAVAKIHVMLVLKNSSVLP